MISENNKFREALFYYDFEPFVQEKQYGVSIISVVKSSNLSINIFNSVCDNIWKLASYPDKIEHIIAFDHNDMPMLNFCKSYKDRSQYKKHIKLIAVQPYDYSSRNIHKQYWNKLAHLASGHVVFAACHDTLITTQGYDKILLKRLRKFKQKYKHDCVQFLVDDDSDNHKNSINPQVQKWPRNECCSWIVLSKSAVNLIGGVTSDLFRFDSADQWTYNLFKRCKHKTQLNLRNKIKTKHVSFYTGRSEVDTQLVDSRQDLMRKFGPLDWKRVDASPYINRIDSYVENYNRQGDHNG